jgi:hypothetical protein
MPIVHTETLKKKIRNTLKKHIEMLKKNRAVKRAELARGGAQQ